MCYEKYCTKNGKKVVSKDTFKERMNNIGFILKPYCGYDSYSFIKEKELTPIILMKEINN